MYLVGVKVSRLSRSASRREVLRVVRAMFPVRVKFNPEYRETRKKAYRAGLRQHEWNKRSRLNMHPFPSNYPGASP